jgi:hypothetical protein
MVRGKQSVQVFFRNVVGLSSAKHGGVCSEKGDVHEDIDFEVDFVAELHGGVGVNSEKLKFLNVGVEKAGGIRPAP